MSEENKRLARRYFEELDRRKSIPTELCTPDFAYHFVAFPAMNIDEAQRFTSRFYRALPDLTHPLDELIVEGDKIAFRARYEGTHQGTFMGVPASGQQISVVGIGVLRVADGRIAECWVSPDRLGLMEQIGAFPA